MISMSPVKRLRHLVHRRGALATPLPVRRDPTKIDARITESSEERKFRISQQRVETQKAIQDGTLRNAPPLAERYADTLREYGLLD